MKKFLQLATLRNTSCGMSSINRHTGLPHSTEHRHPDNACTREGSLVRVSQKLQSVETKAEAVAPVVQQSASRSQQPIHAETSVGVLGTAPTSTKKNAHVLATATPKSRTSSSTRAGERVPRQRYVQACTHTPEEETHTKSLKTTKTCSSAHRALLPGKFSERKKGGGGGGGARGLETAVSDTICSKATHSTSRTRLLRRRKK